MHEFDLPSFRLKRSHKKSRLGCVKCKSRRVKCDETKPECKQCRRRGLCCVYESPPEFKSASPTSTSPVEDQVLSLAELGVSDTELMRHFFSHTCDTFAATSTRSEHVDLWRTVIPALAYTHTTVRRGLLTASALCISHDSASEPLEAKKYFEVANAHGELFVTEARAQARRFDVAEFDSILACSRLLSVLGLAFCQIHRSNGVTLDDSTSWTWLHLLRGVRTVFEAALKTNGEIDPVMYINMIPEVLSIPGSAEVGMQWHRDHVHFALVRDTQEERIEALFAAVKLKAADFNAQQVEDLLRAITILNTVTTHICISEVHSVFRAVASWPGSLDPSFVDMLLENEPLALGIYAHWLMLVALLDSMWWFDDMGISCIREIVDICAREYASLSHVLRWPGVLLKSDHLTNRSTQAM